MVEGELNSIEDLQRAILRGESDWSQYGEVRSEKWENLLLLEYKAAAQWAGRWNWFERVCRGLIMDTTTGEVVARPFDKFFNWGEDGNEPTGSVAEITEKLDGSLGILYRYNGEYRISTRGTFHSEQAQWATQFLQTHFDLSGVPEELTLLFEIIYPGNRVIVDYQGREDLVLIGVRNRFTGEDWFYPQINRLAAWYGFNVPQVYEFDSIDHILEAAHALEVHREGWVLRFSGGLRVKIKGNAYRIAHRIVTQASFNQVLSAIADGTLLMLIEGIPDEFLGDVRAWQSEIERTVSDTHQRVKTLLEQVPREDRKTAALWIRENCPHDAPYVFAMLDGKDITPLVYKTAFKGRQES